MHHEERPETIIVNGAIIEKDYFEQNVIEAIQCEWVPVNVEHTEKHHHCLVCNVAFNEGKAFRSGYRWLCDYCYDNFVKEKNVKSQ